VEAAVLFAIIGAVLILVLLLLYLSGPGRAAVREDGRLPARKTSEALVRSPACAS